MKKIQPPTHNRRYIVEKFVSSSLLNNKIGDNPEKPYSIYLPPGYFDSSNASLRYPVVYFLHGYAGDIHDLVIISAPEIKTHFPFIFRSLLWKFFKKYLTFEKIDKLIKKGEIHPFILVQPDGSLPIPNIYGQKGLNGLPSKKGCFYLNSPFTGNYGDYVFRDLVSHIDQKYRTMADKEHRALMGGSMGGFGALVGGILYPDQFSAIASLSPAISWLELLNQQMIVPIYSRVYGKKKALRLGQEDVDDILDTADLIFTHNNPLLPSIQRDAEGKIEQMDPEAKKNWEKYDLKQLLKTIDSPYEGISLHINVEESDEYGFADQVREFQQVLDEMRIPHDINIYSNSYAKKVTPHMIGIEISVLPSLKYVLDRISQ